ncbi:MAG: polymer-forming cytoskeletal protein [Nitrospinota bacterium]
MKNNTGHGPIRAFLGEGTEFEGLLSFEGTVRVDGSFKGEIQTENCLIVGESAVIEAEVNVGNLIVMGKLTGNVVATQKVEVSASGHVKGDLHTPSLIIQEGALIDGNIHMDKNAGKKVVNLQEVRSESAAKPAN